MGRRNKEKLDGTIAPNQASKGSTETEIAKVFVRVYPEGATKILKFSDTPDDVLPDTEKNLALLRKTAEYLQQSVEAVDEYAPQKLWKKSSVLRTVTNRAANI